MTADTDADGRSSPEAAGPEAGHAGQEWQPPKDGSWVPRDRLNDVLAEVRDLKARIAQGEAQKAPPKATRAELEAKVEAGQLTREQADAHWESQLTADVAKAVVAEVSSQSQAQDQQRQLAAYVEKVPELNDTSSATYAKVAAELRFQIGLGLPNNEATQLLAVRSALGPINALKVSKAPEPRRETFADASGSGGQEQGRKPNRQEELTEREKRYYARAIDRGLYRGWDAVFKEREDAKAARAAVLGGG